MIAELTTETLNEIESGIAQFRALLRNVGDTADMRAAAEEALVLQQLLVNEVRRQKDVIHQQELTWLGAVVLVAEIERLKADIERSRQVFTWKSRNDSEWVLYSDGRRMGYLYSTTLQRGKVWGHADFSGYFDTPDEARAWVEARFRDSGVIKPIDVVEVRQ